MNRSIQGIIRRLSGKFDLASCKECIRRRLDGGKKTLQVCFACWTFYFYEFKPVVCMYEVPTYIQVIMQNELDVELHTFSPLVDVFVIGSWSNLLPNRLLKVTSRWVIKHCTFPRRVPWSMCVLHWRLVVSGSTYFLERILLIQWQMGEFDFTDRPSNHNIPNLNIQSN